MSDDTPKRAPEQSDLKVTDKRMFTADGELREEYRDVGEKSAGETAADSAPDTGPETGPAGPTVVDPGAGVAMPGSGPGAAEAMDMPDSGPGSGPASGPESGAAFLDLVALLAEPVALYLGDAQTPDGQSHENLDAARLHIDLLDVLREKTAGNLSAQESSILEDVLYRLRMRYVQKRG